MARPAKSLGHSIRGFTLPEVLVVIGVIALLIAILLPAISGAMRTGDMAKAMNNMKQINTWMNLYSNENRDFIVPSQFNYTQPPPGSGPAGGFPIKVRSNSALGPLQYKGTWTDILWTYNELGTQQLRWANEAANPEQYLYDSPDKAVYEEMDEFESPFRSPVRNSRDFKDLAGSNNGLPKPFGDGAHESSLPGFFAANNFFNADRAAISYNDPPDPAPPLIGRWYVNSQIKAPSRSMYLVDSLAGETIGAWARPFDNQSDTNSDGIPDDLEVDFRYNGVCLMLFLDGHIAPQTPWTDLDDLQNNKRVKINYLDRN